MEQTPQTCSSVVRTLLNRISGNPRQQEYTIHSAVFQPFHVVFYAGSRQRGYSARRWLSHPVRLAHRRGFMPCRAVSRHSRAPNAVFLHNEWGSSALPRPGAGGVNPSFSAIAGSSCLISSSSWKFSIFVSPFPLLYFTLGTSSLRKGVGQPRRSNPLRWCMIS